MEYQSGSFQGTGKYNLYYQCWKPDLKTKAVVFLAHGIAEHSGRYTGLATFLAEQGLAVYAFDFRHHGRSEGIKGRIDNYGNILRDFDIFIELMGKAHPGLPIFLLGHSMGSSLSLEFAAARPDILKGLVVSGSPLRSLPVIPTPVLALLYPLAKITPNMGLYRLSSSTLSHDQSVVQGYDQDPLVFRGKLTCRLIISFMWRLHQVESQLSSVKIPVLILHGGEDKLCSPEGSQVVNRKIGSTDKTLITYSGFYHEILNEPEKEKVQGDILEWLKKRI
jgi:acylglycerol lipase